MSIFKIITSAIRNTKNIYRSIVGDKIIENMNNNENSEFNRKNWSLLSLLELLSDLFLFKLPFRSPSWIPKFLKKLLFGSNSKYLPDKEEVKDNLCFLYVNGIMSNRNVVLRNQDYLRKLFGKPVNIVHNVTDSFLIDLIECLIGKETDDLTEPALVLLSVVSRKLLDENVKKLVIICHSQGTIIVSNMLNNLSKLGFDKKVFLEKIEIYAFANCASKMIYLNENLPYIESFANENDIVARLGCNCSEEIKKYVKIDGKLFIVKNKSGHMLNTHYLDNFKIDYPNSSLNKYLTK